MNGLTTNEQRMTSMDIAAVTGKTHAHVLRDIRSMEPAWEKVHGAKFGLMQIRMELPNGGFRLIPAFSLTKTECLYVALKFNDEARARLVLRWEELEKERLKANCVRHLLVSDADVMHEAERLVARELSRNNQKADGCLTTTDIARSLSLETRDLNSFLTDQGVQRWQRGQFRLTAEYEGRGLAQSRLFVYYSKDGKQKERTYLVWTQKGAEMITNIITENKKEKGK